MVMYAGLAGVTAAALVGSLAPLNSTWAADGATGAAARPPTVPVLGATMPWPASPLGVVTGQATPQPQPPRAGLVPAPTLPLDDLTSGPGGKHRKGRTPGDHQHRGRHRAPQNHQHAQPAKPGTAGTAGTSAAVPAAPRVVVSYAVDREWAGGFQGEVRVVNNGPRAITRWEAVIALPRDRVTWFWNANGLVSHHILLLKPLSAAEVVPAGGGTVSVFFTATGPQTTPQACAFDGIACG